MTGDEIRTIVREEIALFWTGGRTDDLEEVKMENAGIFHQMKSEWLAASAPSPKDGPLVEEFKRIMRGDKE